MHCSKRPILKCCAGLKANPLWRSRARHGSWAGLPRAQATPGCSLFQSEITRAVWPRDVLGCAPGEGRTKGGLRQVTSETLDQDPALRRERLQAGEGGRAAIGLSAEEHSAQLASHETRRLQDLFQRGARNVLSATTTLKVRWTLADFPACCLLTFRRARLIICSAVGAQAVAMTVRRW